MPTRTVNQGFEAFHNKLIPSGSARSKSSSHYNSIKRRLEDDFDLSRIFYSGSSNNGTSIAGHSDVDLFASIPRKNLKDNSATTLREVKESLQHRFKSTRIYVDSPAVVLDFGSADWDTVEVIPANYIGKENGKNVYQIPNGVGKWMTSSPTSHNAYVTSVNDNLGKKLKKLIRFAKAWKYYRSVPISSFYLELRITKWMEGKSSNFYDATMNTIFRKLDACGLASIQDPKGISGYVKACASDSQKEIALSRLATAKTKAQNAMNARNNGDTRSAFDWWDKVFNGKFPSYYY